MGDLRLMATMARPEKIITFTVVLMTLLHPLFSFHIRCTDAGTLANALSAPTLMDTNSNFTCKEGWFQDIERTITSFQMLCSEIPDLNTGWVKPLPVGCLIDFDECADNSALCGSFGSCVNTAGSYYCECPDNYIWVGPLRLDEEADINTQGGCQQISCGDPPLYSHSSRAAVTATQARVSDVLTENPVTINCLAGWEVATDVVSFDISCFNNADVIDWVSVDPAFSDCEKDIDECTRSSGICGTGECANSGGSFSCSCQAGFHWVDYPEPDPTDGEIGTCEAHTCDTQPVLSNAVIDQVGGVSYSDTSTYTCQTGYEPAVYNPEQGPVINMICNAESRWVITNEVTCTKVWCGDPNGKGHAKIREGEDFYFGGQVTWTCDDGFQVEDGSTKISRTCEASRKWSANAYCTDIDECAESATACPTASICINTQGSYSCIAPSSPPSADLICEALEMCKPGYCSNIPGGPPCICPPDKEGKFCDQDPENQTTVILASLALTLAVLTLTFQMSVCSFVMRNANKVIHFRFRHGGMKYPSFGTSFPMN